MPEPIKNKRQNWKLVSSGAYGNKLRHWDTWDAVIMSGFTGPISIRSLQSCWPCMYDLSLHEARSRIKDLDLKDIVFNEGAPDNCIIVQGEMLNTPPYCSRVSYEKVKMREALRRSFVDCVGWRALEVFRSEMSPSSLADFELLLESYPDHVFEVSVYSRMLGDNQGRNALIWEIRQY